jgi:hypothetical protein
MDMKRSNIIFCLIILLVSGGLIALPEAGEALMLHPTASLGRFPLEAFSCHLAHSTWEHWGYDIGCFVLMALFIPMAQLVPAMLSSAVAIAVGVQLLHPELTAYGGLSGVNCALFVVFAAHHLTPRHPRLFLLAIALLALKTGIEMHCGRTFFATAGFIPIHDAHVIGICCGLLMSLLWMSPQHDLPKRVVMDVVHPWQRLS